MGSASFSRSIPVFFRRCGFSLVELMIAVAIMGLLAAVAVPAFSRYARRARSSEAMMNIEKLGTATLAYYATEHADSSGAVLQRQFPVASAGLPGQGGWTPGINGCNCGVGGVCAPNASWWANDPAYVALNFSIDDPFVYGYSYYSQPLFGAPNGAHVGDYVWAQAFVDWDCQGQLYEGMWQAITVDSDLSLRRGALYFTSIP